MENINNGIHLIMDVVVDDKSSSDIFWESSIHIYLDECIKLSEMEEIGSFIHAFEPHNGVAGITAIRVLSTSHISCHTWPEHNYISIDLFSCKYFDIDKIIDFTKEFFNTKRVDISVINRDIGIPHKYANFVEEN